MIRLWSFSSSDPLMSPIVIIWSIVFSLNYSLILVLSILANNQTFLAISFNSTNLSFVLFSCPIFSKTSIKPLLLIDRIASIYKHGEFIQSYHVATSLNHYLLINSSKTNLDAYRAWIGANIQSVSKNRLPKVVVVNNKVILNSCTPTKYLISQGCQHLQKILELSPPCRWSWYGLDWSRPKPNT